MKACTRCKQIKSLTEFYPRKTCTKDGLTPRCKECCRELARQWHRDNPERSKMNTARQRARADYNKMVAARRAKNPEKYREHQRRFHEKHPEQAKARVAARRARRKHATGRATAEQIAARVELYGGKCWMCGMPWEHIDHVIPLSRGGTHWPANLRPACADCNLRKGNRREYAPDSRTLEIHVPRGERDAFDALMEQARQALGIKSGRFSDYETARAVIERVAA